MFVVAQRIKNTQERVEASSRDLLAALFRDCDPWAEACMSEAIYYLRGNRHLNLPGWVREVVKLP